MKLMIVAHPDDEVLWGGINLSLSDWVVICSTHKNDPVRSKEFYKTMSFVGVTHSKMFDVKDIETKDSQYDDSEFEKYIKKLSNYKWDLVLTHNSTGEYGHLHHKKVNTIVTTYFKKVKVFTGGYQHTPSDLIMKKQLLQYYKKTQNICELIYDGYGNHLNALNRDYFYHETPFVTYNKKIPLFIHQIWFGNPLESTHIRSNLLKKVKQVAKQNSFEYKLWTNDDLTEDNFPITWKYITQALSKKVYAQVADLARYEILNRMGGIYLDSLFEISDAFCSYIKKHRMYRMIVSNEDPCGLQCKNNKDMKYISNGFFACVAGCPILQYLLHTDQLESIDFKSVHVNVETGPYFFRKGFKHNSDVHIIDTSLIYPFMVHDSTYRKGIKNPCEHMDCLKTFKSLAVYQSGHGGSWIKK